MCSLSFILPCKNNQDSAIKMEKKTSRKLSTSVNNVFVVFPRNNEIKNLRNQSNKLNNKNPVHLNILKRTSCDNYILHISFGNKIKHRILASK